MTGRWNPLRVKGPTDSHLDVALDLGKEALLDQDLAGRRFIGEPGCEVRHRADRRIVRAALETDLATRRVTQRDPGASTSRTSSPSWGSAAERRRCRSSKCRGPRQAEPGPRRLEDMTNVEWIPVPEETRLSSHTYEWFDLERGREEGDMTRRRSVWFIAVAVGALVGTLGVVGASATPPATADATAVMQWNLIAVSTITGVPGPGLPGPAGGAPPASQINMGMVQGAVYDAVNAITPKHHRPYLLKRRFGNTASDEAAVATAAYLVLKNIVETVPQSITFPNRASPACDARVAVRSLRRTRYPTRRSRIRGSLPGPRPRRR